MVAGGGRLDAEAPERVQPPPVTLAHQQRVGRPARQEHLRHPIEVDVPERNAHRPCVAFAEEPLPVAALGHRVHPLEAGLAVGPRAQRPKRPVRLVGAVVHHEHIEAPVSVEVERAHAPGVALHREPPARGHVLEGAVAAIAEHRLRAVGVPHHHVEQPVLVEVREGRAHLRGRRPEDLRRALPVDPAGGAPGHPRPAEHVLEAVAVEVRRGLAGVELPRQRALVAEHPGHRLGDPPRRVRSRAAVDDLPPPVAVHVREERVGVVVLVALVGHRVGRAQRGLQVHATHEAARERAVRGRVGDAVGHAVAGRRRRVAAEARWGVLPGGCSPGLPEGGGWRRGGARRRNAGAQGRREDPAGSNSGRQATPAAHHRRR